MSGRDTRASCNLSHLSVAQLINQPRGRGRGSRSPSPAPSVGTSFFPTRSISAPADDLTATGDDWDEIFTDANEGDNMSNIPADATPEEIRRIAEAAQEESRTLRTQQDRITAALEAATAALQALTLARGAPAAQNTTAPKRKRPDLPAFDKQNIHLWLQRIESAYAREEVTDPQQKFAFLESTIGVNMGPTINSFMFGEPTAENWSLFKQHLLDTFGPTKEQRCGTYLDGVKRDGRRPSDLLALIRDKGQKVSIDDLEKQLVLRELPPDVQKLLQDKVEGLDAAATASLADKHFDKEGRPLNSGNSINNVNPTARPAVSQHSDQMPAEQSLDNQTEVNAINRRNSRGTAGGGSNSRSNNTPAFTPAFSSASSSGGRRSVSRPRQQQQNHPSAAANSQTAPQREEYSICRIHRVEANSTVCQGPKCPSHSIASSCMNSTCRTHVGRGNGTGGRR